MVKCIRFLLLTNMVKMPTSKARGKSLQRYHDNVHMTLAYQRPRCKRSYQQEVIVLTPVAWVRTRTVPRYKLTAQTLLRPPHHKSAQRSPFSCTKFRSMPFTPSRMRGHSLPVLHVNLINPRTDHPPTSAVYQHVIEYISIKLALCGSQSSDFHSSTVLKSLYRLSS
jgi:hypothetical protein